MKNITPIAKGMQAILNEGADRLGRETGFIQREVKLQGSSFAKILMFSFQANPDASYSELAQTAAALGVPISPQGLEQRFTEKAALFMQRVLESAVAYVVDIQHDTRAFLQQFTGVYIRDSSIIALPEALKGTWAGTGGFYGETAALKLQVNLDYSSGRVQGPVLQDGRVHDQKSPYQSNSLPPGSLGLADLGFFSLNQLAQDHDNGVYWITRLKVGTVLYDDQGHRLSLLEWLPLQEAGVVEATVQLGADEHIPCRLIAVRVPQEVAAQRRRRLKEWARKKQRKPSEDQWSLAEWTLAVTNVPGDMLTAQQVLILLRVRWQVELLFKLWKSHAKVDEWRSQNPWRILCEVYSKLLSMVMSHWILMASFWPQLGHSLFQGAKTVQKFAMSIAISIHDLTLLIAILEQLARCLGASCRQQKRKTHPATFQLLQALA